MKKLSSLGNTVLDTNAIIIAAAKPRSEEKSLLERLLEIEGKYYIHEYISKVEVKFPQEVKESIRKLVHNGSIL